ncbi:MAG: hypothetical protein H8E68_07630 [Kiritimatiellaeota bacterium]|nr:hypothetical protein [Kiritimatiellota bacterium]
MIEKQFKRSPGRVLAGLAVRTFLYALLLGAIAYGLLWGAVVYDDAFYAETGPVEIMQTVFALLTALVFLFAGRVDRNKAPCGIVLFTFLFCAVIRESDYVLDTLVCRHAWKTLVAVVLVFLTLYVWRNAKSVGRALMSFMNQPSFGILLSGLLVLVVFSRLFGYGPFWKAIMDDSSYRTVKTIVEEGVELMGYFLILVSSFEYLHDTVIARRNESDALSPS